MKKFILLLGLLLLVCSCTDTDKEYRATIVYTLNDGQPIKETITLNMPEMYTPVYVLLREDDTNVLYVAGTWYNSTYFRTHTVYQGSLKVNVVSFDYQLIRSYTVSSIDGHEIKRK